MKNESIRQIEKKAYEIAYAIFRLSGNIGNRPIAGYLENHCLSLFDSAIYGNLNSATTETKILEYYLRLGGDTGMIHQNNVELLIAEIGKLNSAIAEYRASAESVEPLKLTFSANTERETKLTADIQKKDIPAEVINREIEAIANSEKTGEGAELQIERQPSQQVVRSGSPQEYSQPSHRYGGQAGQAPQAVRQISPQAEIRQSAIAQRIRQFGNLPSNEVGLSSGQVGLPARLAGFGEAGRQAGCRMKDIIEAFPNVSERTLRYDLERLAEQGIVERVGQSGPATSYRAIASFSV